SGHASPADKRPSGRGGPRNPPRTPRKGRYGRATASIARPHSHPVAPGPREDEAMRAMQRRAGRPAPRQLRRARMLVWTRTMATVLAIIGVYFTIPMTAGELTGTTLVIRAMVLVATIPVLTWMVARQVRRALSGERRLGEQIAMLFT